MSVVCVVGIGADGWSGLGETARGVVRGSEVLFGSARQLALVPPELGGTRITWPSPLRPALAGLLDEHADRRRCVLASGDPMLFGIGTTLMDMFGPDKVQVLPAVSSVALACARLGWARESTKVLSLVGRRPEAVLRWLAPGRRLLILSADGSSPALLASMLSQHGYGASAVTVLSELGADTERVVSSTADGWSGAVESLNVVALQCVGGTVLPATGLPDDAFVHDGQLTKRDVRAATLARLAPGYGQLLWDVGAGCGSIAIEWLRAEPESQALAVERNAERLAFIEGNSAALGVPQLQLVPGTAPDVLAELASPDAVFIGGGLSTPGVFPTCWDRLKPGGRLVANAVTLQSEAVLLRAFDDFGGELTRISVSSAVPVGGFTGWRPAMPITQWAAVKP